MSIDNTNTLNVVDIEQEIENLKIELADICYRLDYMHSLLKENTAVWDYKSTVTIYG